MSRADRTAPPSPRCFALVPCAGVGVRAGAGGPKQYAMLAGRPVVAHTLAALAAVSRIDATLVVLAPGDTVFSGLLPDYEGERGWIAHCGGATRAASVAAGLDALVGRGAHADDWVLVHDAARCLLRPEWVDRLIDACMTDEVGGLLALPLADTLKQAAMAVDTGSGDSGAPARVTATLDRTGKWLAQTPQMFRFGLLQRALRGTGAAVTDESSAVEALGLTPRLVPGDAANLKLTWPEDFELAGLLLKAR